MSRSVSKQQFFQEASLSQKLANKDPIYTKLAGSDKELSKSIGFLLVMGEFGLIDLEETSVKLMLALLDVERKAAFATSDRVNEITKMGLQMPRSESVISEYED